MNDHSCDQIEPDQGGWWVADCTCGFSTGQCPSPDIAVDEMMDHAVQAALADA